MSLTEENQEQNVIDLDLGPIQKTKIRIGGDQTRILELNLSDMGIVGRLKTAYKNLQNLSQKVASLSDELSASKGNDEALDILDAKLKELDTEMRAEVDALFDSNVSEICVPNGTMYDPHGGQFVYEYVIESLSQLYSNNLNSEFTAMQERIKKHTGKYTKSTKK